MKAYTIFLFLTLGLTAGASRPVLLRADGEDDRGFLRKEKRMNVFVEDLILDEDFDFGRSLQSMSMLIPAPNDPSPSPTKLPVPTSEPTNSSPSGSCTTPSPFDTDDTTRIHVILSVEVGEYFDLLKIGMIQQALAVEDAEIEVVFSSSDGDNDLQSDLVLQALTRGATGIITVDGTNTTMCGAIEEAIKEGVSVLSFDFGDTPCTEEHLLAAQSDEEMARLVLDDAYLAFGDDIVVGYVNDLNFQPLVNRDKIWQSYKSLYGWQEVFFLGDAASYNTDEALQEAIVKQISDTLPEGLALIYAPWDHLAINTFQAIKDTNSGLALYGADINDGDIQAMISPNSSWKATAGGHPSMIGAAVLRMSLLQISSELPEELTASAQFVTIPSFLFTQDFLISKRIENLSDLVQAMPELKLADFMTACWLSPIDTA